MSHGAGLKDEVCELAGWKSPKRGVSPCDPKVGGLSRRRDELVPADAPVAGEGGISRRSEVRLPHFRTGAVDSAWLGSRDPG